MFLHVSNVAESFCKFGESFFFRRFCKIIIHIRPFVIFTFGGVQKIFFDATEFAESFKPKFSVFLFVIGGFEEERGDLFITVLFRDACKVGVLIASLRFARKRFPKIFFGLSASVWIFRSGSLYNFFKIGRRVLTNGANEISGQFIADVFISANSATPNCLTVRSFADLRGFRLDIRLIVVLSG